MTSPGANGTLLVITPLSGSGAGPSLTPYSARGVNQTLEPITGGSGNGQALGTWLRYSTSGELMNLSYPWFKQLMSTVLCTDAQTPCLNDAWLGELCLVDCACERSYLAGGAADRPVVSGSLREENGIYYYRPQITVRITDIKNSFAEWRSDYNWQISMREAYAP